MPPEIATLSRHRRVLRMRTLTRLRWFAVAGQLSVVLVVRLGLGYELPIGPVLACIALAMWLNIYLSFSSTPVQPLSQPSIVGQLCFDCCQIGAVLFFTGGIQNPFVVWLILPAMIAASSLALGRAWIVFGTVFLTITAIALSPYSLPWETPEGFSLPAIYDFATWAALLLGVGFTSSYAHQIANEHTKLSSALTAAQTALAREEQVMALGGLAAAAAHELGTPLGTIQVTAREMERDLPDGPLKEDAQLLISQTQRCQSILRRLANAGVSPDTHHAVLSLDEMLRAAAKPFLPENGAVSMIEFAFDPDSQTNPPERLQRLPEVIYGLRTLIENAVKYGGERARITASWNDSTVTIFIEDDGPGFSADVLQRLGEPYPRVDTGKLAAGKQGLGLGFFIAKTLLERTGASISFGNAKRLSGAWVSVTWPLANLRVRPTSLATA